MSNPNDEETLEQRLARLERNVSDAAIRVGEVLTLQQTTIQEFHTLQGRIDDVERKLRSVFPDTEHCPHCGRKVNLGARHCPVCGRGW